MISKDAILLFILTVVFIGTMVVFSCIDQTAYQYEYETIDGDVGIARYCDTYRGVPHCVLDDKTQVYGIKQYKRILEEEE